MLTRCNQTETFLLIEKTNRHCLSLFVCHTEKGFNFLLCYYVYITIFTLCVCYIYFFYLYTTFISSLLYLIVCPVMKMIISYNIVFLTLCVCICVDSFIHHIKFSSILIICFELFHNIIFILISRTIFFILFLFIHLCCLLLIILFLLTEHYL